MDELLKDFLTEANEHLADAENMLIQFERNPAEMSLVTGMFRLVHTIKGTSSFIGLERLQSVAHAAETLLGRMRDGEPPTQRGVSLVLKAIDHIRGLIQDIELHGGEPAGSSRDVVAAIENYLAGGSSQVDCEAPADDGLPEAAADDEIAPAAEAQGVGEPGAAKAAAGKQEPRNDPARARKNEQGGSSETIRVTVGTIENIMQLVSELVIARSQLVEIARRSENDGLKIALQRLSGLTTDLQDAVMRARMQPVNRLFSNFPRMVRELSLELGKKIEIVTEGGDTELDRQLIEVIRDPLTHIIRNCADHGIEAPGVRLAQGKPAHGEIKVRAYQEAGQFVIEINDDGCGINVERVKAKALNAGLVRQQELLHMSGEEICRFIFEPGFSTATTVTNVSGRGVGMDVVRSNIESVRGTVGLTSTWGQGTRLTLRIPLTLAIAPALIVEIAGQRYALPQHSVAEVVEARPGPGGTIKSVQGKLMVDLRGEAMPAAELSKVLGIERSEGGNEGLIVVLHASTSSFGLLVDAVVDVQEIVVKPLSRALSNLDVYSGHTILGDGSVLLILDPSGIARRVGVGAVARSNSGRSRMEAHQQEASRLMLFRAGGNIDKVLPTSIISRVELVATDRLKQSDAGLVMLYQDHLIPVVELVPAETTADSDSVPIIVITVGGYTFGLLVERIVDIVMDTVGLEIVANDNRSVGTCRIDGKVCDVVDPFDLLARVSHGNGRNSRSQRNVLLLSGDPQSIDLVSPFVQAAGYRVVTARSLKSARALAESGTAPDVILVDLASPAFDGREAASFADWSQGVPMIGLTGGEMESGTNTVSQANLDIRAMADRFDRRQLIDAISASIRQAA